MTQKKHPRDPVDGILLLDKPKGMSSSDALLRARRLLNARKAGHGGTLDPLATGLLPLMFGEATKFANDSLDADKTYLAELTLGVVTDTADAEGRPVARREVRCDEAAFRAAAAAFVGEIDQLPPMHSALKRDGRPLYEYARAGITLERATRRVTIHAIETLAFDLPHATIRVSCSKGTYIRTLAADIGERLGCGAHLNALRRERVGALSLDAAVTLETLEALSLAERRARLAPPDALLAALIRVDLDETGAGRFLHGQKLRAPSAALCAGEEARVRVYGPDGLLGVAAVLRGALVPQRLIATGGADAATTSNGHTP
jgi:tRNA pseudouridine55 synthase